MIMQVSSCVKAKSQASESSSESASGLSQHLTIEMDDGISMEFVKIPAGAVWMGAPAAEPLPDLTLDPPRPYRQAQLDSFYMAVYETTVEQYLMFLRNGYDDEANWSEDGLAWKRSDNVRMERIELLKQRAANLPAGKMNHWEAEAFAKWLNTFLDSELNLEARLPTEVQWEYCAEGETREGESRLFPWGDENGNSQIDDDDIGNANTGYDLGADSYVKSPAPGGSMPKDLSWCGVYDMAGNVCELVIPSLDNPLASPTSMITRGGDYVIRDGKAAPEEFFLAPKMLNSASWAHGKRFATGSIGVRLVLVPAE